MKGLDLPLTEKEREELRAMLRSDRLMERMVERAVRGRRKTGGRARRSS